MIKCRFSFDLDSHKFLTALICRCIQIRTSPGLLRIRTTSVELWVSSKSSSLKPITFRSRMNLKWGNLNLIWFSIKNIAWDYCWRWSLWWWSLLTKYYGLMGHINVRFWTRRHADNLNCCLIGRNILWICFDNTFKD